MKSLYAATKASNVDDNQFDRFRQPIVTLDRELRRFGRIRTDHYTAALSDMKDHSMKHLSSLM